MFVKIAHVTEHKTRPRGDVSAPITCRLQLGTSRITRIFDTDLALMGIIVTSTQLFFAWRIYALTKRRFLSLLIVFEEITVSAMVTAVKIADAPIFVLLAKVRVPIVVWLSAEVIGDILITLSLVTYFKS
ncbi:hypothetical protein CPB84DRAFT_1794946 [Gymnopilus junonius]|uniref:Uncharacterized protein n=1 Tax=Gymnopilus junonius TaxID=109634 RepID=A0A9P5THP2_GYMJU|nr:hypothetical protein CPB84DRAFT_1794946 [Gymnopilus junonius]